MADKKYQLTKEGKKELEKELETLIAKRAANSKAIQEAKEQGDLSENAEYDAARDEQAKDEARIAELEKMLKNVEIVKASAEKDKVGLTAFVKVYDKAFKEEVVYQVRTATEADILNNIISNESPLGKALLGKAVGDLVQVEAPDGVYEYEVREISYGKGKK